MKLETLSFTIYIKNMVCIRCKMAVEAVLKEAGIGFERVELGWAMLQAPLTSLEKESIEQGLKRYELELMQDKTKILVERIKTEIVRLLHTSEPMQFKLSAHLSQALDYNYTYLANTFSDQEGITLERYFIAQRVERVKQLMIYDDLSLTDIKDELDYSSVSHLCLQFKKVTGLTPAEFKKQSGSKQFIWKAL